MAKSERDAWISLEGWAAKSERDVWLSLEEWVDKFGGMGG